MNTRRNFLKNSLGAASVVGLGGIPLFSDAKTPQAEKYNFTLNYGPHFGMFRELGGSDLLGQLDFMAAEGFRSFEDNGLMKRSVDLQTKIGERLAKLNLEMGVFVLDAGENWKVSYTTGKQELVD